MGEVIVIIEFVSVIKDAWTVIQCTRRERNSTRAEVLVVKRATKHKGGMGKREEKRREDGSGK